MMALSSLAEWDNFYVIVGSSAAGLTGLTFVVIALAADAQRVNIVGLRAFVTPTIVHFAAVLALAAFLSVPHQNVMSLCLGFAAAGIAGLVYVGSIAVSMRRNTNDYVPVREDWLWNVLLPIVAYGTLLSMALVAWRDAERSLYGVAATSLLLLFIGIHNAWDIATWMTLHKHDST